MAEDVVQDPSPQDDPWAVVATRAQGSAPTAPPAAPKAPTDPWAVVTTKPLSPENQRILAAAGPLPAKKPLPAGPRFGDHPPPAPPDVGLNLSVRSPQVAPSTVKSISRTVLPAAGAIAGGTLATRAGGGWKAAVPAAGIGATLGDITSMGVEAATGQPPTFQEVADRLVTAPETGMMGEATGRVAASAIGKVAAPFAKSLTTTGKEALDYLHGKVLPWQASTSRTLNILGNVLEGSLFGGKRPAQMIAAQTAELGKRADEILGQFGGRAPTEASGKVYQQLVDDAHTAAKTAASGLYDRVDELAAGTHVSLQPLKEFADAEAARRGALATSLTGGKTKSTLAAVQRATTPEEDTAFAGAAAQLGTTPEALRTDPGYSSLLHAMQDAGVSPADLSAGTVTFRQAHEIRSALGQLQRDAVRTGNTQLKGVTSQLYKRVDAAMTDASGGTTTPLGKAYQQATDAWRTMAETYEDGILQKVADAHPAEIVDLLSTAKRVDDIDKARETIGPEGWKKIQAAHATELFTGTTRDELPTGRQLVKRLTDLTPETLDAIYPRGTADGIRQLARVMSTVQQGETTGVGRLGIQVGQTGAAFGLLTGRSFRKEAAAILLTPAMLARIATSPLGRKWLTTGLKAPAGTPIATRAASELLGFLVREGLTEDPSGPPQDAAGTTPVMDLRPGGSPANVGPPGMPQLTLPAGGPPTSPAPPAPRTPAGAPPPPRR